MNVLHHTRMHKGFWLIGIAFLAVAAFGVEPTRNWPAWRGENTSGISEGYQLPTQWEKEGKLSYRWKLAIPGEGKSSPVVWGNRIFVTSAITQDSGTRVALYCIKTDTGKLDWVSWVTPVSGSTHPDNGYASSTVTTDGEKVFVFSGFERAGLFAFDFHTGKELWKTTLGNLSHIYGSSSSPVLYENLVLQVCDGGNGGYLGAFDKQTGKTRWFTRRRTRGSWSTPAMIHSPEGKPLVVVNGGSDDSESAGWITAYHPHTGKVAWEVCGMTSYVCPAPIIGRDRIFCASGRYAGPVFSLRSDSTLTWSLDTAGAYIPTGLFYQDRLYLVSDGGVVSSYDPYSSSGGKEKARAIWRQRLGGEVKASLTAGDGKLYAATTRGTVFVMEANDTFKLLARNEMREAIYGTPAFAEGVMYLRTESQLYAIGEPPIRSELTARER